MGLLHSAFLFDYKRFRQETFDLLCEADRGNYLPIYARARQSVQCIEAEEWILHLQGTTLSLHEIETDIELDEPIEVGYHLLVVLSAYLLRKCPSLAGNWGVLQKALQVAGWSDVDIELLVEGMPIEKLLKPDIEILQRGHQKATDPYWRWVIPTQAYASGWLPGEEVRRLRCKLQRTEKRIQIFDFSRYPGIDTTNPTVIREYGRYLQTAYANALALLLVVEKAGMGVFMVIS